MNIIPASGWSVAIRNPEDRSSALLCRVVAWCVDREEDLGVGLVPIIEPPNATSGREMCTAVHIDTVDEDDVIGLIADVDRAGNDPWWQDVARNRTEEEDRAEANSELDAARERDAALTKTAEQIAKSIDNDALKILREASSKTAALVFDERFGGTIVRLAALDCLNVRPADVERADSYRHPLVWERTELGDRVLTYHDQTMRSATGARVGEPGKGE